MRRLFWILLILIVSVWVGIKMAEDPGFALFAYKNWTMEMPLWFAIISLIILLLIVYLVLRFFDSIDFTIYRWRNWLSYRRKYKSYSKTNRGLIELIEGQWRSAEYNLTQSVHQSDAPLINFLAAAKAAQEQGAFDRRDNYLRKAHQVAPNAEVAIGLTQAELQYEQGQYEQSLATLHHLLAIAPKHVSVLKLIEKVYVRLSDWQGLIKLLPSLRKYKVITPDQWQTFEKNIYQELLRNVASKNSGLEALQQTWQTIPKEVKKDPELIDCYAQLVFRYPESAVELKELIQNTLKKKWNSDLVRIYGMINADPQKQLVYAESWYKHYGNQAILLLTLGRICMHCNLWGKAKTYLEESIKLSPTPESLFEYGKFLEQQGNLQQAGESFRNGLNLSLNGQGSHLNQKSTS